MREAAAAGAAQMSGLFDRPTNGYALGNTGYYVTDPTASLSDFAPGLPASTSYNGAVASGGRDPNAVSRYLNSAGEIVVVSGDLPQVPEGWEYLHDNALIVSERGVTPAEFAITALGFATFGAAPALYAGLANTGRGIYQAGQAVYGSYRAYGAAATAATYNYELSVGAILTAEAGAALTGAYYGEAALVLGGMALGVGKAGYSRAGVGNKVTGSLPGETIFVTPKGVAVTSDLLELQGSSRLAGNFRGLEGASVEDIASRVPRDWTMVPQDRGAGIKFLDTQGYERIRLHGPSSTAPVGSNSASGWTLRIMDRAGNYYDKFGNVVPYRANSGHIPIRGNPVLGQP